MLIESDMFIAHMKKSDWLKEAATKLFEAIEQGKLKNVQASTEIFHEIYYVFSDYTTPSILTSNLVKYASLDNITFLDATMEIHISALELMNSYNLTSIFDALYAATVLNGKVPDKTIISTDSVYDRIPGIKRIDPRKMEI